MKVIKFEEVWKLLEECSACIVADHVVTYPATCDDEDEEIFLRFTWEDDGLDFELEFKTLDNQTAKLEGSSLFLVDTDGAEEQITLLKPWEAEVSVNMNRLVEGM